MTETEITLELAQEADRDAEKAIRFLAKVKALKDEHKTLKEFWFDVEKHWDALLTYIDGEISRHKQVRLQYEAQMIAKEEERRKKEEAELAVKMKNEAVVWLLEKGRKIGVDFLVDDALKVANELAFREAVGKRQNELTHSCELIEFDGMNCDECSGWDGVDSRCMCGNRRVCWSPASGHSFKEPSIIALAY